MSVSRTAPQVAVVLAGALAMSGACWSSSNAPPAVSDGGLQSMTFAHPSIRDVDVLFVIDDAPGMAPSLARLRATFSAFTETLRTLPAGSPNLHVALITADLGAGVWTLPGCTPGGDQGVFWSLPRGACTGAGLPRGASFFSIVDGKTNFDPSMSLADALACVAVRDDAGCRFPHPLAAALRALGADGRPAPPENAGFLRAGAFLSIIVLTNQDDCSAPTGTAIFDPSSMFVGDPLGPLTSFRCAEYGVTCGGVALPLTQTPVLEGCQSAEDGTLSRVSDVVAQLKALKNDPNMILVAALSGPPDPFAVELLPSELPQAAQPWPALAPSCTSGDGVVAARPGVRLEQWVYAFGHNGTLATICDDLSTSLRTVATSVASVLGPPCLDGAIAKKVGPHGPRSDCTIVDYAVSTDMGPGLTVPSCVDAPEAEPCWTLSDAPACPDGKLLQVKAPTGVPGSQNVLLDSSVACVVCDDPNDARCH